MSPEFLLPWPVLLVLSAVYALIYFKTRNPREATSSSVNNPNFLVFQKTFLPAYCLSLVADWLQGPYMYHLYERYHYERSQIAVLYIVGHLASLILGTFAAPLSQQFGRRNLCILFTVFYTVSCFMKLTSNYGILLLERLFGGMATSLLFFSFEAWYLHEHVVTNDFPKEWIAETMRKLALWNGWLSVLSGLIAFLVFTVFHAFTHYPSVGPFLLAVPFLLLSGIIITLKWKENYGTTSDPKIKAVYVSALQEIGDRRSILLLAGIQTTYEGVLTVMAFLWTPVLTHSKRFPLGVVFSCLMLCIIIGSASYSLLRPRIGDAACLGGSITAALLSCSLLAAFVQQHHEHDFLCFFIFLLYEMSTGLYFSSMRSIRDKIIPETHALSIASVFKIAINLVAIVVLSLMVFHEEYRLVFLVCASLICGALIFSSALFPVLRHLESQSDRQQSDDEAGRSLVTSPSAS